MFLYRFFQFAFGRPKTMINLRNSQDRVAAGMGFGKHGHRIMEINGSQSATLKLAPKRKAYAHLARGILTMNGQKLVGGDALFIEDESSPVMNDGIDAEVLIFDLSH